MLATLHHSESGAVLVGKVTDGCKMKYGYIRTENIHRDGNGKDKAINRFYPLSSNSGEPLADQLHRIGKQIALERGQHERCLECKSQVFRGWRDSGERMLPAEAAFDVQEEDETTDNLLEEVRERIAKLRQRGIAEHLLEQLIHLDDRLSRLVVTSDYRILLPDYNDMEIKMEPLVKAVYLLFLRHPEGIMFKSLPDYRKELSTSLAERKYLDKRGKQRNFADDNVLKWKRME